MPSEGHLRMGFKDVKVAINGERSGTKDPPWEKFSLQLWQKLLSKNFDLLG